MKIPQLVLYSVQITKDGIYETEILEIFSNYVALRNHLTKVGVDYEEICNPTLLSTDDLGEPTSPSYHVAEV